MMLIYLSVILLIVYVVLRSNKIEGFMIDSKQNLLLNESKTYRDEKIYDDFYSYIYDDIYLTIPYLEDFIKTFYHLINKNSNVLCLGSKTGHIVQLLSGNAPITGMENSQSMIKISKYKYPNHKYLYGNYLDSDIFKENKYTHIICPMMTFNTIENINLLFSNVSKWLIHKGYFIAMVIDLKKTPVKRLINHNPSSFFRHTFDYDIKINENNITDVLRNKQGYERTNIQSIYYYDLDKIIYTAQMNGMKYKYYKEMRGLSGKIIFFQKD